MRTQRMGSLFVFLVFMSLPSVTNANSLAGDIDNNGICNIIDLNMVLIDWGRSGAEISDPNSDTNGDGKVDIIDLNTVLIDWGKSVHTLTVVSGSGDGSYTYGQVVGITADPAQTGEVFDEWVGDTSGIANTNVSSTTITMPRSNTAITATYEIILGFSLTVTSGTGSGTFPDGTPVSISANTPPGGMEFNMWVGARDDVNIPDDNLYDASTSFTMPAQDVTWSATYKAIGSPLDCWPAFNYYCKKYFGAEKEPLQYEHDGNTLAFDDANDSEWRYVSEESACIGFETTLPAKTYIEYGLTTGYGNTVYVETGDESERYYYLHLGYLTGLSNDTTYHYRFVAEDERSNIITSPDKTFITATPSGNVVYIPGSMGSPKYTLGSPNTTYVVTQDINAGGTAFQIKAHNVTLDLGGHTITYNITDNQVSGTGYDYTVSSAMGVKVVTNYTGLRILNGKLIQGEGYNSANGGAYGYSPIHIEASSTIVEIAGVSVDYIGQSITGMRVRSGTETHHNVIKDRGSEIENRHQGTDAIKYGSKSYNNLVKRVRQRGITKTNDTYHNEIYGDSWATNSHLIGATGNSDIYDNHVFGGGYLAVGIASNGTDYDRTYNTDKYLKNVAVYNNFVHFQLVRPYEDRWPEYGIKSGGHPARCMWGGDNIEWYDNTLVSYAKDGGETRGIWLETLLYSQDVIFHDNVIKTIFQNDNSIKGGCVMVDGKRDASINVTKFEDNEIIGNYCLVSIGSSYGLGRNTTFRRNHFKREGYTRSDFNLIHYGYWHWPVLDHYFYDSTFEGDVDYNDITDDGDPGTTLEFFVGWTLRVETEADANVVVEDVNNNEIFNGVADSNGVVEVECLQYKQTPSGRTYYTDHEIKVNKDGSSTSTTVTMDSKKTVVVPVP